MHVNVSEEELEVLSLLFILNTRKSKVLVQTFVRADVKKQNFVHTVNECLNSRSQVACHEVSI